MYALGIESTAHTFGIGVVKDDLIVANEKITYRPKEGIIPSEAAEFHKKHSKELLKKIEDKIDLKKIDVVGVSIGPGLPPCLEEGVKFAKRLSKKLNVPLIGINHCQAHIEIGVFLTRVKDPIILYVSGGNTQVIHRKEGYRILGETQDIGIGNAIDKLGRSAGIRFPAGPKIEKIAKGGKFVMLPYSVKGMDLNFSGILSETIRRLKKEKIENLFYSFQEVCFAMLTEVTERALAATEKKEVLLVGGVSQNKRLQQMLNTMCKDRGAKLRTIPKEFAGDNGAMIAITTLINYKNKKIDEVIKIKPNWRVDSI